MCHLEWVVSPTGFEPVLPAPEAGALSGLSYGDAVPVYKEAPAPQAVRSFDRTLRIPSRTVTLLGLEAA